MSQILLTFGDFVTPGRLQRPGVFEGATVLPITFGEGYFEIPYLTADNETVSNRV